MERENERLAEKDVNVGHAVENELSTVLTPEHCMLVLLPLTG